MNCCRRQLLHRGAGFGGAVVVGAVVGGTSIECGAITVGSITGVGCSVFVGGAGVSGSMGRSVECAVVSPV